MARGDRTFSRHHLPAAPQEGFLGSEWTGIPGDLTRLYGAHHFCFLSPLLPQCPVASNTSADLHSGLWRLTSNTTPRIACAGRRNSGVPDEDADDRWRWHRFVKLWARSQAQVADWAERHLPKGSYYRLRIEDLAGFAPLEQKA